jgi:gliding motility-associated-like protein
MRMRFLIILVLLVHNFCYGLDKAPNILRVCLDNNTSIATICWKGQPDACNSFKSYYVYSSENNGPWILEAKINNINISCLPIFLNNINVTWDFKITAHSGCNGIDSFTSNIMSIDQTPPLALELDSVSFDLRTQNLSAGWKSNFAPDTKGYRVYQYNNSVSNRILDLDSTFVILPGYNKNNPTQITLATFDSCNIFARISDPQKPAYLNGNIDTCLKTINLNWTPYAGWANMVQFLYVNKNNTGYYKQPFTSINNKNNITLTNITLGDSLCYLIRTQESVLKKTSSSNAICFYTRNLKAPKTNYLNNVTVENDSHLEITFDTDISSDIDTLFLEKALTGTPNFSTIKKYPKSTIIAQTIIQDLSADFNSNSFTYRTKTFDKCLNLTSTSNIGTSILLNKPIFMNEEYHLKWNPYKSWELGILDQTIEYSYDRFTWNTLQKVTPNTTTYIFKEQVPVTDSVCFRIVNSETTNSLGSAAVSISNIHCVYVIKDFYLPGTINPNSHNNTFKIYGSGIDKTRQKLEIFNRWGEKVFESTNLQIGWDGKINGEIADMGNYIYKATFYDQTNKYYLKTGSLLIIR